MTISNAIDLIDRFNKEYKERDIILGVGCDMAYKTPLENIKVMVGTEEKFERFNA